MICEITGKLVHVTRKKAENHRLHLKTENGYRGEVYRCEHCRGFHVGRNKKTRKRKKQIEGVKDDLHLSQS